MGEVGADRLPARLAHALGQQVGDAGEGQAVDDRGVDPVQFGLVEARRGAAETGEIERGGERAGIERGIDRIGGAQPREQRNQRLGLDPRLAQLRHAERAEPLGQLALRADQQRLMREARRLRLPARRTSAAGVAVFET